ncbi:MAG: hypothetical protein EA370_08945 [Wenzhouxiangella sp.]|nr:MAG: hypothetical protein EA370_08945 [Wenzhouxiangella sp.]
MFVVCCLLAFSLEAVAELRSLPVPAEDGSLAPTWTALADGRAVLSWLERIDSGHAFRFAILDDDGFGPVGEVARGEDWFANWADMPGLFELANGAWLAHWLVKSGPATYAYDVVMAVSTDQGETWSGPFSPHDDGTPTEHGFVSYFHQAPESAGVIWLDGRETGGGGHDAHTDGHHHHGAGSMTLRAAVVDSAGEISAPALLDERVCDCCQTAAAVTDQGPVVIYRGRSAEEIRDIWIVRRIEDQWSEPTRIHDDGWRIEACPVNGPALIARQQKLVAAWFTLADGVPRVELVRSMDSGASFSHLATLGQEQALGRVDLAWWQAGFVVSWLDQVGGEALLRLAHFDEAGELRWERELAELDPGRIAGFPRLVSLNGSRLLVAWTEPGSLGPRVRVAELKKP